MWGMKTLLIHKLALERCKNNLSHLCAVIHMSDEAWQDSGGGDTVHHLITSINRELDSIERGLEALDQTRSGQ